MIGNFTAKNTKIDSGYYGQIIEWPEVITEGKTLEECRFMLQDALNEMIMAYQQLGNEIPTGYRFTANEICKQAGINQKIKFD